MSNYRKAWVAIAGALAQIAVVLDQAVSAGILPDEWVPWVRVVLAVATAFGVWRVRNVPSTYVPRHDAGSTRTVLVTLVGFAIAGLLVLATLVAGPADAHRRPPLHVRTNGAQVCSGVLLVAFSLEELRGNAWTFRQDDGSAVVQLRHQGAAAGPGGHWETYATASGGEGHLRVDVVGLPYWDAVRVVHGGIASSERLPEECAA